jgi:formate/nitrite transporter
MKPHASSAFLELKNFAALLPKAIARSAEDGGVEKASLDTAALFVLAVLGGAFIALGGLYATVVMSGSTGPLSHGESRSLGAVLFSIGLILAIVGGGKLFSSDCHMFIAGATGRIRLRSLLGVWTTVWMGNFVGALAFAALVFASGNYKFDHGAVGAVSLNIAESKSSLPVVQAIFLGILCNALVCLAAWFAVRARNVADRILAIAFPVFAFVFSGFEHCVANMYFVPLGIFIARWAPQSFWSDLGRSAAEVHISAYGFMPSLVAVTLGNWIGGAMIASVIYWFSYRRASHSGAGGATPI